MASKDGDGPPGDADDSPWLRETERGDAPVPAGLPAEGAHYQLLELLGAGAMGEVRKAFDPRLGRFVALKILRNASPELAPRLLKEARAQAKVEHANVCKVYGVGELDGQPFIALQYVGGGTLAQVAPSMSREALIRLMKEVAEALHAAHRQGLVHRDIKPTNILVEKLEGGQYKPYVADFGIARELESPGLTASGVAVGTPMYMAPEQALGQTTLIDRRTDVYGLGATLYELLAKQRPFQGANALEVMAQVINEDPPSLRSIDPTIPIDLETIVLKAMEKRPQQRYDSARALADDLQRWLDGDPVESRRGRWVYRWARRARKHRAAFAALSVAVVVAALVGGVALRARFQAAERARLQKAFGQEVERSEAIARFAVLLPLHDTSQELAAISERMAEVRKEMAQRGAIAAGPGHDALGRAHLALGQPEAAVRELDQAWAAGERSPEVSYALGLGHGALYQQGLATLLKADDPAIDEQHRQALERDHRDPALAALDRVGGADGSGWKSLGVGAREYAEALTALYHERYDDALAKADAAAARVRWLHEAHTLKGEIHLLAGIERNWKRDFDGALGELQKAGEAYRAATTVAPSSTAAWLGECQRLSTEVSIEVDRGRSPGNRVTTAVDACGKAHTTRPDDPKPLATEAWVWGSLAFTQQEHNEDLSHAFEETLRSGQAALALEPRNLQALIAIARVHQWRAWDAMRRGADPVPIVKQGMQWAERVLAVDPREYFTLVLMSQLWSLKGDYESDQELDVHESVENAVRWGNRALEVARGGAFALDALGHAWSLREYWELGFGGDPTEAYHHAIEAIDRNLAATPNQASGFNNKCAAEYGYGEWQRERGVDPTATLERAIATCQRSVDVDPQSAFPLQGMGEAYVSLGQWQRERAGDALATVQKGLAAVHRAIGFGEQNAYAHHVAGDLELLAARLPGADAAGRFDAAEREYRRSLALNAHDLGALSGLAELYLRRAEWRLAHHQPVVGDVALGLDAAAHAEKTSPRLGLAPALAGALHLTAAHATTGDARAKSARAAASAIERAIGLNANLDREYHPLLDEARRLAK
jgi:serine/threonine-protein kinase